MQLVVIPSLGRRNAFLVHLCALVRVPPRPAPHAIGVHSLRSCRTLGDQVVDVTRPIWRGRLEAMLGL
eukprot:7139052-Prorocentrum_lima.AAC.1